MALFVVFWLLLRLKEQLTGNLVSLFELVSLKGPRWLSATTELLLNFLLQHSSCRPHGVEGMRLRQIHVLLIIPMPAKASYVAAPIDTSAKFLSSELS